MAQLQRGIVFLYLCECEIAQVSANTEVVRQLAVMDAALLPTDAASCGGGSSALSAAVYPVSLSCYQNLLGDRGSVALVRTLLGMQWLEALDLRGCGLGKEAVAALCSVIPNHRHLKSIDLRENPIFATSARRLCDVLKKRQQPLLLKCDIAQLPRRIASELLLTMGARYAAAHSIDGVTAVPYPQVVASDLQKSQRPWQSGFPELETMSETRQRIVREWQAHESSLLAAYKDAGQFVLYAAVDFGVQRLVQPAVLEKIGQQQRSWVAQFIAGLPTVAALDALRHRGHSEALVSLHVSATRIFRGAYRRMDAESSVPAPPCSKTDVWDQLVERRGSLLREQYDSLSRVFSLEDAVVGSDDAHLLTVLSRVVRGVAAATSKDLPVFARVEEHLDRVYRSLVIKAYDEDRHLALVCQQLGYLAQNYKPEHQDRVTKGAKLHRPTNVDVSVLIAVLKEAHGSPKASSTYAEKRAELLYDVFDALPPLLIKCLMDVAAEAAVSALVKPLGISMHTLAVLLDDDGPAAAGSEDASEAAAVVLPAPPKVPRSAPLSVLGSSAASQLPLSVTSDVVSLLGSIRGPLQVRLLFRLYSQWLRWMYFVGAIHDDDLDA